MAAKRAAPKQKYDFLRRQSAKTAKRVPQKTSFAFGAPGAAAARKKSADR
jgi:hypothetical protein